LLKDQNKKNITLISPERSLWVFNLVEALKYLDLIYLLVKRDFVTFYKQTILGPLWYIIQPIFNSLVFTLVFTNIAGISTDGIPPFLFYMAGTVIWGYFAYCLKEISNTFAANAPIFGKVYFPRLAVPISLTITGFLQFIVQFCIFLGFLIYFYYQGNEIKPNKLITLLPLLIVLTAMMSVGFGMLLSAITAKYRDLKQALEFIIQLWMFLTPVVYPVSQVPEEYQTLIYLNPMTSVVELFREMFLGVSSLTFFSITYTIAFAFIIFLLGLIVFNRVEKNFIDTV
tara:strand:- start:180 stop:1034 length:855 start_codon:yes stop_codon:yes gene_type:complete